MNTGREIFRRDSASRVEASPTNAPRITELALREDALSFPAFPTFPTFPAFPSFPTFPPISQNHHRSSRSADPSLPPVNSLSRLERSSASSSAPTLSAPGTPPDLSPSRSSQANTKALQPGTIAGIVIGAAILILLVLGSLLFCIHRRRQRLNIVHSSNTDREQALGTAHNNTLSPFTAFRNQTPDNTPSISGNTEKIAEPGDQDHDRRPCSPPDPNELQAAREENGILLARINEMETNSDLVLGHECLRPDSDHRPKVAERENLSSSHSESLEAAGHQESQGFETGWGSRVRSLRSTERQMKRAGYGNHDVLLPKSLGLSDSARERELRLDDETPPTEQTGASAAGATRNDTASTAWRARPRISITTPSTLNDTRSCVQYRANSLRSRTHPADAGYGGETWVYRRCSLRIGDEDEQRVLGSEEKGGDTRTRRLINDQCTMGDASKVRYSIAASEARDRVGDFGGEVSSWMRHGTLCRRRGMGRLAASSAAEIDYSFQVPQTVHAAIVVREEMRDVIESGSRAMWSRNAELGTVTTSRRHTSSPDDTTQCRVLEIARENDRGRVRAEVKEETSGNGSHRKRTYSAHRRLPPSHCGALPHPPLVYGSLSAPESVSTRRQVQQAYTQGRCKEYCPRLVHGAKREKGEQLGETEAMRWHNSPQTVVKDKGEGRKAEGGCTEWAEARNAERLKGGWHPSRTEGETASHIRLDLHFGARDIA
ncbi:hypothetical protein R3P38DRAFT_3344581 [Favolaschia claudopus]|uniref:Uncharacterized protein n=1 Tax=Favolaschia claudopus TaxID=2862362 RepID=A0AAW0DGA0_9AGAR